ncbi:Protein HEG-1 [Galemys pyrenaicus]|uniref:Protein HEG-1 n=1 Tax=Galemys pyrenaicus TaxID=202257 RepID=A0A8J6DWE8_GALPY|nr:Protein HEG-1 [Galemys pyrenaicus]
MASPRASRWPPPPPLLLLLLLLPAPPGTRGQPPPSARRAPSGAPLAGTGLVRPPEPGPEREPPPPPQPLRERRGPASPDPSQPAPAPGAATRRGPSGRVPRGRSAEASKFSLVHFLTVLAAMRGHWLESNNETPVENITFDQNQVDFSTVTSEEVVLVQTFRKNHASSDAAENFSLQTETANAGGRNDSSRRTNFTISPDGPEMATVLTSQSSTLEDFKKGLWLGEQEFIEEEKTGRLALIRQLDEQFLLLISSRVHVVPTSQWSPRQGYSDVWRLLAGFSLSPLLSASGRPRLPSSSSGSEGRTDPSRAESGTPLDTPVQDMGLPEDATLHTQVAATSVVSRSSPPALETEDETTVSRKSNSLGTELSWAHFSRTSSPASSHASSSGSAEELNTTALQDPSVRHTVGVHVATGVPYGVPGTISLGPLSKTERFPEDSKISMASASFHSSSSEAESRRNSGAISNTEGGEFAEPSTGNAFGLTSSEVSVGFWPKDSPTLGGRQLISSSGVESGSGAPRTEAASRSIPSVRGRESTAPWFLTESRTVADGTGSATSYPQVVNASVLTQFSASAPRSRGSDTALHETGYSEPSAQFLSSSSSESLDFSAPHATEDGPEPGASSAVQEGTAKGTPGTQALGAHTAATFTGSGERTLRSLTNGSTTSRGEGHSVADPETESATLQGDTTVTGDAHLVSDSLPISQVLGVTGVSSDPVSGTNTEQRTPSDLTDHTYVSSAFTKGERALLSITDNSSSSDTRESSTSVQISNFSHPDYSPSSQVQMGTKKVSPDMGDYAQPSTESLAVRPAHLPSYTPTVNVANTLVFLDAEAGLVADSSSSESPLPLPSVSQSYQPFSSSPSTRAATPPQKSTLSPPPPSSPSPPPPPVSMTASTPASRSIPQTTLPPSLSTLVLPRVRATAVTSDHVSTEPSSVAVLPSSQTAGPGNQSSSLHEKILTDSRLPNPESPPTEATNSVTVSSTSGILLPPDFTEFSPGHTLPVTSTSSAPTYPSLTASTLKTSPSPGLTASPPSSTAAPTAGPTTARTPPGKPPLPTSPEILVPHSSRADATTTRGNPEHLDTTTQLMPLASVPSAAGELTTGLGTAHEYRPASHFLGTSPSQSTDVSTAEMSPPPSQSSTQSPVALSSPASAKSCATNPCLHDGKCLVDPTRHGYRCMCSPSWQGDDCSVDVNECLHNPCPPLATCNNTQGSFTCTCPVGYQLEKGICNLVRTFMTELTLKKSFLNTTMEKHSDLRKVESEIKKMLNMCFSKLPGYTRSTVRASRTEVAFTFQQPRARLSSQGDQKPTHFACRGSGAAAVSLQTVFSLASNVTLFDLADKMQKCVNSCRSSAEVCQLLGSQRRIFRGKRGLFLHMSLFKKKVHVSSGWERRRSCLTLLFGLCIPVGSLCKRKTPECDRETSVCTDLDGVARCQCKLGYFQFNKMDHSCRGAIVVVSFRWLLLCGFVLGPRQVCRLLHGLSFSPLACEDGYRLENETCMSSHSSGVLMTPPIYARVQLRCAHLRMPTRECSQHRRYHLEFVHVTFQMFFTYRKNKNDISKLIFKSGDFQMSPYAEYPKNPRSQEWGREAIEMHENGSTKNLLQMTDVYYSVPPSGKRAGPQGIINEFVLFGHQPMSVRNPELERNGLYPAYTGLPGSRHSCIFPGQYNPSFISDESRRRDYF